MQYTNAKPFSRIRGFLWPIHGHEHKKLIPMFMLFFLISFVYNVLRCMKVTLVVTADGSGAEVIPYLKMWVVLPGALLLTYLYTKLSNYLNREQVFYAMISIFLGFFTFFMVFLHPNRESLELTTFSHFLSTHLPKGLNGFVSVIRHWPLSLFYVLAELWSAVVLSMLFWGFANEITPVDEAKRFYAIFALGANSSGIFSGQCAQLLTLEQYNPHLPFGREAWEQSLILQLGVVLAMGVVIILLFRWLNRRILPTLKTIRQTSGAEKEPKTKVLSLGECFAHLAKSRYMVYITVIVVAYNLVYNLSDVLWTEQIRQNYPSASEFNAYINKIASITGIFATLSALMLSGNVIRRYGWTATALITPAIWLVTSIGFFGCLLLTNYGITDFIGILLGIPLSTLALMFGSAQICLGRAAKYTVFDESKEIAFIPLPKEDQRKGKAVVDGIASRFGKSGGSLVIQILLLICGELALTIPYVAVIFSIALTGWIIAVRGLGKIASQTIDKELHATVTADDLPKATVTLQ
jgi:AAA family ATP:ADP antiporter